MSAVANVRRASHANGTDVAVENEMYRGNNNPVPSADSANSLDNSSHVSSSNSRQSTSSSQRSGQKPIWVTVHELLYCDLAQATAEDRAIDVLHSTLANAVLSVSEWRYVRLAVKLLNSVLTAPKINTSSGDGIMDLIYTLEDVIEELNDIEGACDRVWFEMEYRKQKHLLRKTAKTLIVVVMIKYQLTGTRDLLEGKLPVKAQPNPSVKRELPAYAKAFRAPLPQTQEQTFRPRDRSDWMQEASAIDDNAAPAPVAGTIDRASSSPSLTPTPIPSRSLSARSPSPSPSHATSPQQPRGQQQEHLQPPPRPPKTARAQSQPIINHASPIAELSSLAISTPEDQLSPTVFDVQENILYTYLGPASDVSAGHDADALPAVPNLHRTGSRKNLRQPQPSRQQPNVVVEINHSSARGAACELGGMRALAVNDPAADSVPAQPPPRPPRGSSKAPEPQDMAPRPKPRPVPAHLVPDTVEVRRKSSRRDRQLASGDAGVR